MNPPPPPKRPVIDPRNSSLVALDKGVRAALSSLPGYFRTGTYIEGLEAADLFNLNSVLGSSIEIQVVETLNAIRTVWDPGGQWVTYRFERFPQSFPDVRLVSRETGQVKVAMGMELKGWYLLSKEGEPSFRYKVTPAACADVDLFVVVPWYLKNVLSGVPVVLEPFIDSARYVAEYRNYWWSHVRDASGSTKIRAPTSPVAPYPATKSKINDEPESDTGGNFGRVARIGVMDEYDKKMLDLRVCGIRAEHWVKFFKTYSETSDPAEITRKLEARISALSVAEDRSAERKAKSLLQEIVAALRAE